MGDLGTRVALTEGNGGAYDGLLATMALGIPDSANRHPKLLSILQRAPIGTGQTKTPHSLISLALTYYHGTRPSNVEQSRTYFSTARDAALNELLQLPSPEYARDLVHIAKVAGSYIERIDTLQETHHIGNGLELHT